MFVHWGYLKTVMVRNILFVEDFHQGNFFINFFILKFFIVNLALFQTRSFQTASLELTSYRPIQHKNKNQSHSLVKCLQNLIEWQKNWLIIFKHQRKKLGSPIKTKLNRKRLYPSKSVKFLDIKTSWKFKLATTHSWNRIKTKKCQCSITCN